MKETKLMQKNRKFIIGMNISVQIIIYISSPLKDALMDAAVDCFQLVAMENEKTSKS
jgi:hypothetical protein